MTTIHVEQENLVINVEGADKLWALKSSLSIPLAHVVKAEHNPEAAKGWWHGIKFPGTNIPGIITAGSFYQHGEFTFWDVHHPENAIVITLHDENYKQLVVEVANPQLAVQEITAAL